MPFKNQAIKDGYSRALFSNHGSFRNDETRITAQKREDELLRLLETRTDHETYMMIIELIEQIGIWSEFETKHYFQQGWLIGRGELRREAKQSYERLAGRFELYALLEKGMEDIKAGHGTPENQVFDELMGDLENGTL